MFIGCNEHDYITIASPNKSKCLTVEQVTSIRPGFKPYLKLYFGVTSLNKNEYIQMPWDDVGGFGVNWGANPIVITGYATKNTIPSSKIIFKRHLSEEEEKSYNARGSLWRTYDFELLVNNKYDRCK